MLAATAVLPTVPPPAHALAAVVHPNPYAYYQSLAAHRPFDFDASLGLWVAAGPQALAAVLRHPACGVRPAGATVPAALAKGAAGDWFGALVRMNDGATHAAMKPWLKARLASLHADGATLDRLRDASQAACADAYLAQGDTPTARLDDFVFRQPIYALAAWLGVPSSQWVDVYDDVRTLVAAMAESAKPSPRAEAIARGHRAATALCQRAMRWLDNDAAPGTWLRDTARIAAHDDALDHAALTANVAGLFTQTHDACAGLVANSLRRLARHASPTVIPAIDGRQMLRANLAVAIATVSDVIRLDPPVQNTRRFLHAPAVIGERTLARGDAILVVLAAAPASAGPDDMAWTFGHGAHTCPGRSPASTIAALGVQTILDSEVDLAAIATGTAYHPLGNVRIARFHEEAPAD
ncbi:cytochrome p450 oxidoreductase [Pandoraea eparura]|jgi:cytochrome P450|uniref:Cytochrome p450 oxidoreductase n=1 Tax=Pandoraea eparura TaxID=2508291 RepID=A0A5E4VL85_9BURK|nr:cytochrome P450 [Pandoraea eparura]VVE11760.1 cytochrome p450 oxidoreductase [Pandoraea eparura]